ncbi:hypothetical protein [Mycobacterium palustre]|uniref:Uncharacterized protein n=1 Tax=Mycobacterium palustre TaxID=153971 RepID=A0A1X1ZCB6_9MYCO|nr:hypothetical protein [Mycobacterium palustre]MCV7100061.1 hypothetical protein [Mycobacterium palustre]ORW20925.1 hypothetical protein AWC19_14270 [Mycobacterium palustre]
MKLVGCDRCPATFPAEQRYSAVWIFGDITADNMQHDAPSPTAVIELCPNCRRDLDAFLARKAPDADAAKPKPPQCGPAREICGRTGVQRFVQTDTGWRCSPTIVCEGE